MKTKDKILLIFIFAILMLLITGTKVEATATLDDFNNLIVGDEVNITLINENLSIPTELEKQKYFITYYYSPSNSNYVVKIYYFNPENWPTFYRLKLYEKVAGTGRAFTIRPYTENNNSAWDTSTDKYCEYFYGCYQYTTTDFLTYTLDKHLEAGVSFVDTPSFLTGSGTSMYKFVNSNVDIYAEDYKTMVFQKPVEQLVEMVGLVPLEAIQVTQIPEKITKTLEVIVPIAILVFSMLLSPFLIRYLISLKR